MAEKKTTTTDQLSPAIKVNDSKKKPWFDSVCGCLHSLNDGVMRGTDVVNGRKRALLGEYDDVGNTFGSALKVIVALKSIVLDAAVALQMEERSYPVFLQFHYS